MKHEIGHLPFEADVTDILKYGKENRITVSCNNALLESTIPQGKVVELPRYATLSSTQVYFLLKHFNFILSDNNGTSIVQTFPLDFFNYAGIDRSVVLYTTPKVYIVDIITNTDVTKQHGRISYEVIMSIKADQSELDFYVTIQIRDRNGDVVTAVKSKRNDLKGSIKIKNANLWWPYLMHPEPGYLYTMEV